MLPIFIFTGAGSKPQNAFLLPCAAAAFPVKKEFRKIRRFSGIVFLLLHAMPKLSGKVWRICPLTAHHGRG